MKNNYLDNIPRDIPLGFPAPQWLLESLLIISFVAHILFVNLMVGGSLLTTIFELIGLKDNRYDKLAKVLAKTVTVNKSLAVVLGVAPLLTINALYTVYFYTSNAMTGVVWIAVIPLVTIAFLLTYLHKYTWEYLQDNKLLHCSISALATSIFLFIPFIFLSNVTTMLFPERWDQISGFLSSLLLPGIFPRYIIFLGTSIALTSLMLIFLTEKKHFEISAEKLGFEKNDLFKKLFTLSFLGVVIVILISPFLYFIMPAHGKSIELNLLLLFSGAAFLIVAYLIFKAINANSPYKYFKPIIELFLLSVFVIGIARHEYRENVLAWHKKLLKEKTQLWTAKSKAARTEEKNRFKKVKTRKINGKKLFRRKCSTCHAADTVAVGPSIEEIQSIYKGNPQGIITWTKNPGKKREGFIQMPGFESLGDKKLEAIAKYLLEFRQK